MIDCWHNFIELLSKSVTVRLVSRWWRWVEEYKNKIHTIHYLIGASQHRNMLLPQIRSVWMIRTFICWKRKCKFYTHCKVCCPPKNYIFINRYIIHFWNCHATSHVWQCDQIIVYEKSPRGAASCIRSCHFFGWLIMSLLSFYQMQLGWNFNMLVSELMAAQILAIISVI